MTVRAAAGALAVAVAAVTGPVVTAGPASAADEWPVATGVAGNFVGDQREEVFAYQSGAAPDRLVRFSRAGGQGGPVAMATTNFAVGGRYTPLAGDFDGDGYDEIIWYAPGAAADYLWDFTSATTFRSQALQVSGTYRPVTGDFTGDGADDVLWYAPGTAADRLWEFGPGGGRRDIPLTVNGDYTPLAGSIATDATDDVLWMRAGSTYLWDFHPDATYRSTSESLDAGYEPFVLDIFDDGWGGDDIFWREVTSNDDHVEDFIDGSSLIFAQPVGDGFWATAGDFLGDGHDDVIWTSNFAAIRLWDYAPHTAADSVHKWDYRFPTGVYASTTSAAVTDAGIVTRPR